MSIRVDAVVLAGADNSGRLAEVSDARYEATIEINGKPMLEWVLTGICQAECVDRIIVVGPVEAIRPIVDKMGAAKDISVVERRGSMIQNLLAGLEKVPEGRKALVASSDIPFINGEAIDGFVKICETMPAEVHYALVPKKVNEAKFPGGERTYIRMADGVVTGGNVFMADPAVVRKNAGVIKDALGLRKKPLALLSMLGLGFVIKFAFHRLSIADVEKKAKSWIGLSARGVIVPYAEIGVDVDKPSDYELAKRMLS
ncbi:MAG: nucleotidyltransferase family protein [Clostridia bacterium]|nr:nucleotidyltransferase family protein [Clostridia bacterium]